MRKVVVYPGEDGYWVVECPSLAGCISQGRTKQEAIVNIKEAIEGYIAALDDDGLPVPEDRFEALVVAVRPACRESRGDSAPERSARQDSLYDGSTEVT